MKRYTIFVAVFFALLFFQPVHAQEAVEYMNKINGPISELKNDTWKYLKAVTRGKSARKVESKRQALIKTVSEAKTATGKVSAFKGDASLKASAVEYLDILYTVLKEDYDKILDMEDIAEQSYDAMEAYLLAQEKAGDKLEEAGEKLEAGQKDFAQKNSITLLEAENDKKSQKIKKASETLHYYNQVYLIFFKCYKQEAYVLNAQNNGDVSGVEQNANTLSAFVDEGLAKLKALGPYKADLKLNMAARDILAFYKREAEKDFPACVDLYIKKDNMEKAQKAIDAKGKKRTQKDVDQYNKVAQEYNDAVNKFNRVNENANKERVDKLNEWNKKVQDFFDAHS